MMGCILGPALRNEFDLATIETDEQRYVDAPITAD